MQIVRASLILIVFACLTLPLMPLQWVFLQTSPLLARRFPCLYHRMVCRLVGVRLHVEGPRPDGQPALLIANHISWLDIPVMSAVAPVSFVAKREVGTWPFVAWLAKLQRSLFVDRERRTGAFRDAHEIMDRLHEGDSIVLFPEGTSSDGNRVLPFRSSLLAAVKPSARSDRELEEGIYVQTLAIGYTHLHGLPLARRERPGIAWYGDMEMAGHAWQLLKLGPLDVRIRLGEPVAITEFHDRKALARHAEERIRKDLAEILSPRN
jgi:1-acyl-sn-glycerol-3-phosphate acyltransferase